MRNHFTAAPWMPNLWRDFVSLCISDALGLTDDGNVSMNGAFTRLAESSAASVLNLAFRALNFFLTESRHHNEDGNE